ncbi:MAG: hypothetical protein KF795_24030, partial [Labilithrix sp.]|nr:hypothetical protein [Labilithrix sp.]
EARREVVYVSAENAVNANPLLPTAVTLGPIDPLAIAAFKAWHAPTWDWERYARHYRHARYARLELAIWAGTELCGLALGKFSPAETVLQMNFVEGAPHAHPLKGYVLEVAVTHGIILGSAYGSKVFRVTKPGNHVQNALAALAEPFTFVAQGPHAPYPYSEWSLP